ncbi:MAG: NAD(P)H-dependent oxidoreductase subunit E [Candidatus Omnitrophica bacterium]|nr:NAD(P)H-dependent oxidoreductase subunit E [Candidatus Omnitrophota bacterium]MDD5429108.1 NAD(P)H-dependent oxidoreductase subunit E [Candidatus Omnitrophota bacterium]
MKYSLTKHRPEKIKDRLRIDNIISRHKDTPGELLNILEETQILSKYNYLSPAQLKYIAEKTSYPLSVVYSVTTFYSFFNLKPQGEHCIIVCRGTACHTKGSRRILDYLESVLDFGDEKINEGEKVFLTTKDKVITIKTVACFGQCALAPVVEVDGIIHSRMTVEKMKKVLSALKKKGLK